MKLIDVLQKIANGELEEGTKIKHAKHGVFELVSLSTGFWTHLQIESKEGMRIPDDLWIEDLNDEVEIIPKVAEKEQKSSKTEENIKELDNDYIDKAIQSLRSNRLSDGMIISIDEFNRVQEEVRRCNEFKKKLLQKLDEDIKDNTPEEHSKSVPYETAYKDGVRVEAWGIKAFIEDELKG